MRRLARPIGALALALLLAAPGHAQLSSRSDAEAAADTLVNILNYTRWPEPDRPRRVCLFVQAGAVEAMRALLGAAGLEVHFLAAGDTPEAGCDVVFSDDARPGTWAAWLPALAQRPVLTAGMGSAFCSAGGQFCLLARHAGGGWRFAVNTDGIGRSRLRVNPRVLRLGTSGAAGASAPAAPAVPPS